MAAGFPVIRCPIFPGGWALLVLILGLAVSGGCPPRPSVGSPTTQTVTIAGKTFHLELALTASQRHQGLSDRREIAADGGMLFVFPRPQELTFVMRRCLVPIDLIFLDASGRIVALHEMTVEPYDRPEARLRRYESRWPAQFAIELQGGMIQRLSLKIGQKIHLPMEELKRSAQ